MKKKNNYIQYVNSSKEARIKLTGIQGILKSFGTNVHPSQKMFSPQSERYLTQNQRIPI